MATINLTPGNKYKARVRSHGVSMSKTFSTRKAAQTWAKRVERKLEENRAYGYGHAKLKRMTLKDVCEEYLEIWSGKDGSRTARVQWWIDRLGHMPVLEIDKVHVREKLKAYAGKNAVRMTRDGRMLDRGHKVSGASVNRLQAALSSVFAWGMHELDLPSNPCHEVKGRAESKHMERFLTRDEVAKLLEACRDSSYDRLYLAVLMALNTGARRGELLKLKWADIDWKNATATLTDTKNKESRVLPLSPEVMTELGKFRPTSGKVVSMHAAKLEGARIFRGQYRNSPVALYPVFQAAVKAAGLEPLRIHDLRHTAASLMAQAGASLLEIANVLGHRSISTTKRYSHFCIDSKRALTDRVLGNLSEGSNDE